ncbi:odorant receptor 99PSE [Diachasma alloeum]|uniref:Odorant receptor 99PSE n=1 Tax=Diachasma alloeum TaxID=454923 RepID=A0A4E0RNI1_9HYME|nr:odorant receptor 67a [Diachasma alloeum]THK32976.1 odorant receptor 99PSE [Diachasma alloeum]
MVTGASLCTEAPSGILPYKAWYPYNTSTPLGFWSAYLHQIIAHAYGAFTNAACDTLIYGMIMQICAQFAILQHRFHLLPKSLAAIGKNIEQWERKELGNCVRHHLRILHFADECNRVFDSLICLQFLISSTVLCVSVYRLAQIELSSPDFPIIVMYLMCMLSQIFILCFSGSHLIFESHNMVHGIYDMDWTPLTLNTKKSLIFIIGKCLRPVNFTCCTILPLSIHSFNQLIKLSYSTFNVLQQSSGVSH